MEVAKQKKRESDVLLRREEQWNCSNETFCMLFIYGNFECGGVARTNHLCWWTISCFLQISQKHSKTISLVKCS